MVVSPAATITTLVNPLVSGPSKARTACSFLSQVMKMVPVLCASLVRLLGCPAGLGWQCHVPRTLRQEGRMWGLNGPTWHQSPPYSFHSV